MRDFIILLIHVIGTLVRLAGPGGLRSVVAESALVRHGQAGAFVVNVWTFSFLSTNAICE